LVSTGHREVAMPGQAIIAGCGGGYDVFGGLPLYSQIVKQGSLTPILVSFSFVNRELLLQRGVELIDHFYAVRPGPMDIDASTTYFPEWHLARQLGVTVYAFDMGATVRDLIRGYEHLMRLHPKIIRIFLIDGGCDVLLTGHETGLGTPVEDMIHLKAVMELEIPHKTLLAVGVNIDVADGVVFEELIQRLEDLQQRNILCSKWVLTKEDPTVIFYMETLSQCRPQDTIAQSLIVEAIKGSRGNVIPKHLEARIDKRREDGGSTIDLSELTCTLHEFDLMAVGREVGYLDLIDPDMNRDEVDALIIGYQAGYKRFRTVTTNPSR